ncbi:MAG: winged helix-turn-helix transcriptional regulator [Hyphomicrobiales bacterium]|nr:winged helix-turn-helix transcriptional regulator [Hyphomicrobiales bacterium]
MPDRYAKSPLEDQPTLRLENFLPYRLHMLADVVSQALARIYSQRFGLSVPEWRVIATLGQFDETTATTIVSHSRMHKTKVSRAVSALVEKGLVARKSNADDLREAFLRLTDRGWKVYRELIPEALGFAERLTEGLAPAERELLDRLMDRLIQRSAAQLRENGRENGS